MASDAFQFTVVERQFSIGAAPRYAGFLIVDNWNDWFEFTTMYFAIVFDQAGERHELGQVKIGQFSMPKGQPRPSIPGDFAQLGEEFFSLGQDESYYAKLATLESSLRNAVLGALRDVVEDPELFRRALAERVTTASLLRHVSPQTVRGQFRRVLYGGARLTHYSFVYTGPRPLVGRDPPAVLEFQVHPESHPPTNIHVLIGRNGVGKTYILNRMTQALLQPHALNRRVGRFDFADEGSQFANLVSITFSAFDPFEPLPEQKDRQTDIKYSYIGLKRSGTAPDDEGVPKTLGVLAGEFAKSVEVCIRGAKRERWLRVLEILDADPIFRSAEISALAVPENESPRKAALKVFKRLSSGHRIVLLTITRLVETVEEQTLVLIDEPETHLHPPLLSALIRSVSDLLINRNGVAIVATHSPVVLQEVPKNCVWKLRRSGTVVNVERPEIETFGENVGVLTREVFGLEVTQSGFHRLIQDAIEGQGSFADVLQQFDGELGGEARAIAQALIVARDSDNSKDQG